LAIRRVRFLSTRHKQETAKPDTAPANENQHQKVYGWISPDTGSDDAKDLSPPRGETAAAQDVAIKEEDEGASYSRFS
jgi:hypothetical protein